MDGRPGPARGAPGHRGHQFETCVAASRHASLAGSMRPQDLLRFHPFIGALGERDADELLKQAITRRFQPNDVIFRKDDPGTGLDGVVSGRVVVVADSAEVKELILNVFGPGEYFGEIALLDGEGRTATAIAREPSELRFLDRQHFMPFLARSPDATS